MTDEFPDEAREAFQAHDAFEPADDGYRLTTTDFDATMTATGREDYATDFEVTVEVPTLDSATEDEEVGDAVQRGWFDTMERRLADAPMATRASVDLDEFDVRNEGGTLVVTYAFSFGDAGRAVDVGKTFIEYVEGTYVESVVPGYEYEGVVADLLGAAATGSDGERGGTPL